MVWIKNLIGGATWEVTQMRADELMKWYPNEYELVAAPGAPAAEASAEAGRAPVAAPKAKNGK